jgi:hypothetical protein
MLVHAIRRWPSAINVHLWPMALRYANLMHQHAPQHNGKASPIKLFSGTKVIWNPLHSHTFGSPVYVLNHDLQAGKKIPKWEERAQVSVFLSHSPKHAHTVSLVLSLTSGLTSPQFHCVYDNAFQTMRRSFGSDPPISKWQQACGFIETTDKCEVTDGSNTQIGNKTSSRSNNPSQASEGASEGDLSIGHDKDHPMLGMTFNDEGLRCST